jgi:hypothetical protein
MNKIFKKEALTPSGDVLAGTHTKYLILQKRPCATGYCLTVSIDSKGVVKNFGLEEMTEAEECFKKYYNANNTIGRTIS